MSAGPRRPRSVPCPGKEECGGSMVACSGEWGSGSVGPGPCPFTQMPSGFMESGTRQQRVALDATDGGSCTRGRKSGAFGSARPAARLRAQPTRRGPWRRLGYRPVHVHVHAHVHVVVQSVCKAGFVWVC